MSNKKGKQPVKQVNPIVAEFQSCCKTLGFQDEEMITELCQAFNSSETQIRIVHKNITPQLGKVLLRLFQRYQRLQGITLYACVSLDPVFLKQLSNDLVKSPVTSLSLDYSPIQREALTPFLSLPSLEMLSLRGNQCLTPYDYVSQAPSPFPATLNIFFNQLTTSNLKILNLYACHIGDAGAIALAHTLYFNTNLKCICLSRNRIGDEGAIALAQALSFYPLSENEVAVVDRFVNEESKQKISDEGGSLLKKKGKGKSSAPKKPPPKPSRKGQQTARTVTERLHSFDPAAPIMAAILTKWSNVVTNENGVRVLPGNTTLSTLLLDENQITGTGAQHLEEMLKVNKTLVNFTVNENPEIDPAQIAAMERNCQQQNTERTAPEEPQK